MTQGSRFAGWGGTLVGFGLALACVVGGIALMALGAPWGAVFFVLAAFNAWRAWNDPLNRHSRALGRHPMQIRPRRDRMEQ